MRGDQTTRRQPFFFCRDEDNDTSDEDDFDDDDGFGDDDQSDALSSSGCFFSRPGGSMNRSAANLLRSASLLAMPSRKKCFTRR